MRIYFSNGITNSPFRGQGGFYKDSTTAFVVNHDAHSDSQKSNMIEKPLHGFVPGCAIDIYYHVRLYAAGRCRNKIAVRCLTAKALPKTIIDWLAVSKALKH